MKEVIAFCSALLLLSSAHSSDQSIAFGQGTRQIFPLDAKTTGISVSNYSKSHFLVHAKVVNSDQDRSLNHDFLFVPELIELKPEESRMLTLRRVDGSYPSDRESLLYLVSTFIPNKSQSDNQLELSYSISMKLFLRPRDLMTDDAAEESREKISFTYRDKTLVMKNLSPYYLVFNEFKADSNSIHLPMSAKTLSPFGETYLPLDKKPNSVSWSLIGDSGYPTAQSERLIK